ncbi:MAG: ribonuclease P protein subunit [Desulfurococcales archaeon]|nr:ribonuclease P protein subunit [Desulfurococcales archaeon]
MRHTKKNILYHELIGLRMHILEYPDQSLVGVSGIIIDETKKTLLIETMEGLRKRILKEHGVYEIWLPSGGKVIIRGSKILGTPEERLKRIVK